MGQIGSSCVMRTKPQYVDCFVLSVACHFALSPAFFPSCSHVGPVGGSFCSFFTKFVVLLAFSAAPGDFQSLLIICRNLRIGMECRDARPGKPTKIDCFIICEFSFLFSRAKARKSAVLGGFGLLGRVPSSYPPKPDAPN